MTADVHGPHLRRRSRRPVSAANVQRAVKAGQRLGLCPCFRGSGGRPQGEPDWRSTNCRRAWDQSQSGVLRDALEVAHRRSLYAVILPIYGGVMSTVRLSRAFLPNEITIVSPDAASLADPEALG